MDKCISKAEFAKMAGLSRSTVSYACSKKIPEAVSNNMVDMGHPDAIQYLNQCRAKKARAKKKKEAQGVKVTNKETKQQRPKTKSQIETIEDDEPETLSPDTLDIENYGRDVEDWDMQPVCELLAKHGTAARNRDWLKARQIQVDTMQRLMKLRITAGEYISRELVTKYIFGALDGMFTRFLIDFPQTIYMLLKVHVEAGGNDVDGRELIRDNVTSNLEFIVKHITNQLKQEYKEPPIELKEGKSENSKAKD